MPWLRGGSRLGRGAVAAMGAKSCGVFSGRDVGAVCFVLVAYARPWGVAVVVELGCEDGVGREVVAWVWDGLRWCLRFFWCGGLPGSGRLLRCWAIFCCGRLVDCGGLFRYLSLRLRRCGTGLSNGCSFLGTKPFGGSGFLGSAGYVPLPKSWSHGCVEIERYVLCARQVRSMKKRKSN